MSPSTSPLPLWHCCFCRGCIRACSLVDHPLELLRLRYDYDSPIQRASKLLDEEALHERKTPGGRVTDRCEGPSSLHDLRLEPCRFMVNPGRSLIAMQCRKTEGLLGDPSLEIVSPYVEKLRSECDVALRLWL